jgi:hypothetical protein
MKTTFSKLKSFLKSKPQGIDYTWGKMLLWSIAAIIFIGAVSFLGKIISEP